MSLEVLRAEIRSNVVLDIAGTWTPAERGSLYRTTGNLWPNKYVQRLIGLSFDVYSTTGYPQTTTQPTSSTTVSSNASKYPAIPVNASNAPWKKNTASTPYPSSTPSYASVATSGSGYGSAVDNGVLRTEAAVMDIDFV